MLKCTYPGSFLAHVRRFEVRSVVPRLQPNLRRYRTNISSTWDYIKSIISKNVDHLSSVNFFAHNDMDMMEIGNGNLTIQEERTHFAVWAFMKSPILLGTEV
jgi:hypothetical protein